MPSKSKSAIEMVRRAAAEVPEVDPAELARSIGSGDAVVVDVREHAGSAVGMTPGAIHVPRGILEFAADPASPTRDARLDPGRPAILYCASGGRSTLAAGSLVQLGYEQVSHLGGGIAAWTAAGFKLAGRDELEGSNR